MIRSELADLKLCLGVKRVIHSFESRNYNELYLNYTLNWDAPWRGGYYLGGEVGIE